jgi:conjugative relaxase-like TrwC/TraI family protein
VLRIKSGHSVDYYLEQVATGRESYYTGAVAEGEPPGRWYGSGAAALGLSGLVDAQDATAVYAHFVDPRDERFRDPQRWEQAATLGHTGRRYLTAEEIYAAALAAEPDADFERRDELRLDAAKRARHNVAFLDATFSVQKSISVLHAAFEAKEVTARTAGDLEAAAAWGQHRAAVEDAIWAGNNAMLDYLSDKAGYSRIGHHGGAEGRFIDAHDWTIASFFQHDSRDHDPHLHIHNTVLNRVQCSDGVWRTLHGRGLYLYRPAAAAVAERTTEEYLIRALAVRLAMRPDGKAREVLGIARELIEAVSSRDRAIGPKLAELATEYEAVNGRAPRGKALDRLNQHAADMTRPPKSDSGLTRGEFLQQVDREVFAATGAGLATVAEDVVALAGEPPQGQSWSPSEVLATAIAVLDNKKGGWTEADLTREINNALPDYLGGLDGLQVAILLERLTADGMALVQSLKTPKPGDDVLTPSQRLADGKSAYDEPGGQLYASPDHIHTERVLQASATRRGAPALATTVVEGFLAALAKSGIVLGADQAAAVAGVLGSGACVESLVGPAGTGKSFVTGMLAQAWQDPTLWEGQQRRVVGLATTEVATGVLEGEGLAARNISRWLAIQDRLTAGHPVGDDQAWQLSAGDLVMVDESSMVDTSALAAVHQHVTAAGAKLLLTGDHRQLAAIGAGGGMELIVDAGASYELTEARRFTHEWEQQASLRLRAGDQTVLTEYHKHGRLIDAGTLEQAEDSAATAWLADTLAGKHSLLSVNSNEQAARLSAKLRTELIRLGLVEEAGGVPVGVQGNYAGVNDLVQARRIARHLTGYEGNRAGPINRQQYRVLATHDDGGLVVVPVLGRDAEGAEEHGDRLTLPGGYVREHIELGYAATEYSIQGVTVGTTHNLTTPQTSRAAFYMAMTRGRTTNTAHIATQTVSDTDAPIGAVHDAIHRSPAAILGLAFERDEPERSALAIQADSAIEARSVRTAIERLAGFTANVTTGRTVRWLDQLADQGHLTPAQRQRIAAEDGAATLARVLRRAELAGHDPAHVLHQAVTERDLRGARQLSNVLYDRITTNPRLSLDPVGDTYTDRAPTTDDPDDQRFITALTHAADTRQANLGAHAVEQPPAWALEAFGPSPTDPDARQSWEKRAGIVAAHRELSDHTDPTTPIGPPPKPGQPEHYASFRAAWRALGRPEADTEEMQMSDGALRMRIRAWEREKAWAPPNVTHELAGTRQAATRHRNTATLRAAQAHAATDPDTRDRLQQEAAEAAALADLLDTQVAHLTEIDDAYSYYLVDTAVTRANAHRAQAALAARHATNPPPEDTTSTQDWLAADAEARRADDAHRDITDHHDLTDHDTADLSTLDDTTQRGPLVETVVPDIRELAATETPRPIDDTVHVPTAEQTADDLTRARRALAETRQRQATEVRHRAEQAHSQRMARWQAEDQAADYQKREQVTDHATPTLEPVGSHE